jgi:acetyl-CoA acetyltransferase
MLKEIHLAGSVRTPFGSFCGAFADVSAAELGKAAVGRSGVQAGGRQRGNFRKIPL